MWPFDIELNNYAYVIEKERPPALQASEHKRTSARIPALCHSLSAVLTAISVPAPVRERVRSEKETSGVDTESKAAPAQRISSESESTVRRMPLCLLFLFFLRHPDSNYIPDL